MAYTINQVRHFYVANSVKDSITAGPRKHLDEDTAVIGDLQPQINKEKDHVYFEYMGPGGVTRSDLIKLSKISYIKVTDKVELRNPLKVFEVEGDAKIMNVVSLKLRIKQFLSLGEEDVYTFVQTYVPKDKVNGDNLSDVLKEIAFNLAKGLAVSAPGMFKVLLDSTEVTRKTKLSDLSGTYAKLIVEELPQKYNRLQAAPRGINFELIASMADKGTTELKVTKLPEDRTTKFVPNGMKIADMERFYHGARGDYYRMNGFPNVINTEYVSDPSQEYYTLDIHYAHADEGISTYHSEKDITIASTDKEALNAIAKALKGEIEAKGGGIDFYEEC